MHEDLDRVSLSIWDNTIHSMCCGVYWLCNMIRRSALDGLYPFYSLRRCGWLHKTYLAMSQIRTKISLKRPSPKKQGDLSLSLHVDSHIDQNMLLLQRQCPYNKLLSSLNYLYVMFCSDMLVEYPSVQVWVPQPSLSQSCPRSSVFIVSHLAELSTWVCCTMIIGSCLTIFLVPSLSCFPS